MERIHPSLDHDLTTGVSSLLFHPPNLTVKNAFMGLSLILYLFCFDTMNAKDTCWKTCIKIRDKRSHERHTPAVMPRIYKLRWKKRASNYSSNRTNLFHHHLNNQSAITFKFLYQSINNIYIYQLLPLIIPLLTNIKINIYNSYNDKVYFYHA